MVEEVAGVEQIELSGKLSVGRLLTQGGVVPREAAPEDMPRATGHLKHRVAPHVEGCWGGPPRMGKSAFSSSAFLPVLSTNRVQYRASWLAKEKCSVHLHYLN